MMLGIVDGTELTRGDTVEGFGGANDPLSALIEGISPREGEKRYGGRDIVGCVANLDADLV